MCFTIDLYVNLLLFSLLSHVHVQLITMILQIYHRFRSMKVPVGSRGLRKPLMACSIIFTYYLLLLFLIYCCLLYWQIINCNGIDGCIIVVNGENIKVRIIERERLSKESTCVRIFESTLKIREERGSTADWLVSPNSSVVYCVCVCVSYRYALSNKHQAYLPTSPLLCFSPFISLLFFSLRVKCVHLSVIPFVRLHFRIAVRAINGEFPTSPMNKECAWLSYSSLEQLWNWNL